MQLSTENLTACLDMLSVRGAWSVAANRIGAAESTLYLWLSRSKAAAQRDEREASPFWIMFRDEWNYWHEHCRTARRENILSMEALYRDACRNGQEEVCYEPSTGRPLIALDPQFIGVSDEAMCDQFLNPARDRYLWNADGTPVYQTRFTAPPASLKVAVLKGLLPKTYGDKSHVSHHVSGGVMHSIQPTFAELKAKRVQDHDVVDVEVREITSDDAQQALPSEAQQRAELMKQKVAEHLARLDRITSPQAPVEIHGRPAEADRVTTSSERPRPEPTAPRSAPRAEPEASPRPSYARPGPRYPAGNNPTAAGAVAMKVVR